MDGVERLLAYKRRAVREGNHQPGTDGGEVDPLGDGGGAALVASEEHRLDGELEVGRGKGVPAELHLLQDNPALAFEFGHRQSGRGEQTGEINDYN